LTQVGSWEVAFTVYIPAGEYWNPEFLYTLIFINSKYLLNLLMSIRTMYIRKLNHLDLLRFENVHS